MKLSTHLLAVVLSVASTAHAAEYPYDTACLKNHPNIFIAINAFCKNMEAPSAYAGNGFSSGGKWVGIREHSRSAQKSETTADSWVYRRNV